LNNLWFGKASTHWVCPWNWSRDRVALILFNDRISSLVIFIITIITCENVTRICRWIFSNFFFTLFHGAQKNIDHFLWIRSCNWVEETKYFDMKNKRIFFPNPGISNRFVIQENFEFQKAPRWWHLTRDDEIAEKRVGKNEFGDHRYVFFR
jgi:hypothetical protein